MKKETVLEQFGNYLNKLSKSTNKELIKIPKKIIKTVYQDEEFKEWRKKK